jgi:hypothetical protein
MVLGFRNEKQIRKYAICIGIRINTSLEYLLNISLKELGEILEEVVEIGRK